MNIFRTPNPSNLIARAETLPEMAAFLEGLAISPGFGQAAENLRAAATFMRRIERDICGQGYVCTGGPKCGSDHK